MKNKNWLFFALVLVTTACFGILTVQSQTSTVIFHADLNSANIENSSTVGVRGNKAPLSWTETTPMTDNGDGTYTLKLEFEEFYPGEEVLYKYVHGDVVWENDIGSLGNRAVYLYEGKAKLPADTWDKLERYAASGLLENALDNNFWNWIYIIGSAMENGLSPEETGLKYMAFWGSLDWITAPEMIMEWAKIHQANYSNGYFEMLEKSPNKLVYKFRKTWLNYFGNEEKIMNVSREEMTRAFEAMEKARALAKGWKCEWADEGELIKVTLEF